MEYEQKRCLTGDADRLLCVPLSLEVGQFTVEVSAVVERHVGEAQLCRAMVDDRHLRGAAVALIVVTEADGRAVVGARVRRQDVAGKHQHAANLHRRVVRQQVYTQHNQQKLQTHVVQHSIFPELNYRQHPCITTARYFPKDLHYIWKMKMMTIARI